MKFALSLTSLLALTALLTAAGCSAETVAAGDEADSDVAASQDELTASAAALVGAFQFGANAGRAPTFDGVVFKSNGEFFADVDTGIRCVVAPCPSSVRLTGRFTATRSTLTLSPAAGERAHSFHGRYNYSLAGDKLSLSRAGATWASWGNDLAKESSYCAEATDCAGQSLIVPACVGHFTCGEQRSCGFACGVPVPTSAIWPADRQQLVAENAGGGFVAPPPAGSTCAVGAQKYSLDIATRKLAWEQCNFDPSGAPLHLVRGSRTISAAELRTVDAAMNDVTVATREICGADKPFLSIKVTSASQGKKSYADSFYSCVESADTYVDHIDGVFGAFRALAH